MNRISSTIQSTAQSTIPNNIQTPIIAPSLLAADFACLGDEVQRMHQIGINWLHLDVMDGVFVPNISFGPPVVAKLPKPEQMIFDAHLMVTNPTIMLEPFRDAGCDFITVHAEASIHLHRVIEQIKSLGMGAGVALNPATSLEAVRWVLADLDLVLIMSVNPGFGGQKYISSATAKIKALRAMIDELPQNVKRPLISVDGGITAETICSPHQAGAEVLVAGTAMFGKADYGRALAELRDNLIR